MSRPALLLGRRAARRPGPTCGARQRHGGANGRGHKPRLEALSNDPMMTVTATGDR